MHVINNLGSVKVVTLLRRNERVNNVKHQMSRAGIKYDIYPAFDGLSCSDDEYYHEQIKNNVFGHSGASKGLLCCSISHIKLLREFIENDQEYLTVFEDDIIFPLEFDNQINRIVDNLPDDFDIVYLGHCGITDEIRTSKEVFFKSTGMCTHGYIVSKRGAERVLQLLTPCFHTLDIVIHTAYRNYLSGRPGFEFNPYCVNNYALGYVNNNELYFSDGIVHQKRGEEMESTLGLHS